MTDRGPLMDSRDRAAAVATWLQSTGLYERVTLEQTAEAEAAAAIRADD